MKLGPYGLQESWSWLKNYFAGPSSAHIFSPAFPSKQMQLKQITPSVEAVFLGDLMNLYQRRLHFGQRFQEWTQGCDYFVINLEGLLTRRPARFYLKQRNEPQLLEYLNRLAPPHKIVFSLSNNHSLDYGPDELDRCVSLLRDKGYQVIGTLDAPSIVLKNKIEIAAATTWSNRKGRGLRWLTPDLKPSERADVRILYTHWGHEFELYPRPQQVQEARRLLDTWDAIVGHHSHCPQPIVLLPKPVAFSLGNFAIGYRKRVLNYGLAVKMTFGPQPNAPNWAIGEMFWDFVRVETSVRDSVTVDVVNECPFFPA